ncbi:MAG: hypothetical protein ACTJHU_07005 [Mycetocola sp.]
MPDEFIAWSGGITLRDLIIWGGVLAGIWGALAKVWPALRRITRQLDQLDGLGDWKSDVTRDLDAVKHEVLPNHGGSLRDAVDRLDDRIGHDDVRISVLEERTQPRDERGRFTSKE